MIVFIETKIDKPNKVIGDLAETIGVNAATGIVQKWFTDYSEFIYDTETSEILLYKKTYSGFWEGNYPTLAKYK